MPYQKGTRRTEELITAARSLAYSESYSYTEGWNDNVLVDIFNLGLDRLYAKITEIDNPMEIEQLEIDVVAQQQEYDIPQAVNLAAQIMDVRFIYGTQPYEYITLMQGMIQDRFSYPTNYPDMYTIRNGKILLSPVPNITKTGALVINFQKRMRRIDVRRGAVSSYDESGDPYLLLNFDVTSLKQVNYEANADSVLDLVDYVCLVDVDGVPVLDAIAVNSYDTTTKRLYLRTTLSADDQTILTAALAAGVVYVVSGDYSSSHSELDRACEDHLIEYAVLRLLRLQSAAEPTVNQMKTEEEVLSRLLHAYRRYRPSMVPIIWRKRQGARSWPFGTLGQFP